MTRKHAKLAPAFGICAALLAGMAITQPGFGEEAGAAAGGNGGGASSSGDQSGARSAASGDAKSNNAQSPAGNAGGAKDGNSPAHNGDGPGAAADDAGVPSRRANEKPDKAGLSNTAASPLRNAHRRTFQPSKIVTAPARNAIGASLPQNESVVHGNNAARPANTPTPHPIAGVGAGGAESGDRFRKVEGSPEPRAIVNPVVKPAIPNRGAINGTGRVNRPGAVSAQLGGPAKTTTGINGSGIRPKY
jgi:hypothetical protein